MSSPTGGNAFPTTVYYNEQPVGVDEGMTLRDYFAAKAMQAQIASGADWSWQDLKKNAQQAYAHADAMLKARQS